MNKFFKSLILGQLQRIRAICYIIMEARRLDVINVRNLYCCW